ncbi:TetR/AcrR family transcriptional regulator [Paenibacillus amylolyticus]|uniref:TetR family transcriptional regulator n=1 Tax=Paenibacillus amylolyticus TaxID=1451 RepID=A0A100VKU4_PAEAM|nr:TetR/AcrR family transcriptional regulator [Paenibacillus amylolyticus]GAS81702.1 TetR family transcriptional regulator [Paenibacillus amylolyticus]
MSSRKQSLLETALALFLEHSYANTTIQMILDQSSVSKGTFYKFFSSKEDCLYSIIDQRMQKDVFIRKELEQNHYTSDYDLLVDQIAIPMSVPNKERVWELYWTGFYSGEINSAKLATVQLNWLSARLIQVYGKDISLYANEGAILCYGILHQIANTSRSLNTPKPVWSEVVPKVLTYIEVILRTMHQRNEHIFDFQSLYFLNADERNRDMGMDIDTLLEELEEFNKRVQKSKESAPLKQLSKGLLALLEDKEDLNIPVIEVVLQAFHKEYKSNTFHAEANRLTEACWWFLELVKQRH